LSHQDGHLWPGNNRSVCFCPGAVKRSENHGNAERSGTDCSYSKIINPPMHFLLVEIVRAFEKNKLQFPVDAADSFAWIHKIIT
jgi:hypothetical protein